MDSGRRVACVARASGTVVVGVGRGVAEGVAERLGDRLDEADTDGDGAPESTGDEQADTTTERTPSVRTAAVRRTLTSRMLMSDHRKAAEAKVPGKRCRVPAKRMSCPYGYGLAGLDRME
jgi:hypothetical protein